MNGSECAKSVDEFSLFILSKTFSLISPNLILRSLTKITMNRGVFVEKICQALTENSNL